MPRKAKTIIRDGSITYIAGNLNRKQRKKFEETKQDLRKGFYKARAKIKSRSYVFG